MKYITIFFISLCFLVGCIPKETGDSNHIIYSGARSSSYGIRPFPSEDNWVNALNTLKNYFPGSKASAIWIVGELMRGDSCRLFFPSDGNQYAYVHFEDYDKHESFLSAFDENDVEVFLQVEPGKADVVRLINLVLSRYKHHPSVVGFGIDVEWYGHSEQRGEGIPVNDSTAALWESTVKSFNQDYRLFLKHWDRDWMPSHYRGDIVFVSDSQIFEKMSDMLEEFDTYWADYFYPNMVIFQYGYRSDKKWWSQLEDPVKTLGDSVASRVKQNCGVFWVDFTLREVVPVD